MYNAPLLLILVTPACHRLLRLIFKVESKRVPLHVISLAFRHPSHPAVLWVPVTASVTDMSQQQPLGFFMRFGDFQVHAVRARPITPVHV